MASTNQKVPIPLPVNGVRKNENPRTIGPTALVDSLNWVYRDGIFSVRPGIGPLDPGGINLLKNDYSATLDMDTFPFHEPADEALGFPLEMPGFGEPLTDDGTEHWYPFVLFANEYNNNDVDGWITEQTWQAGQPPMFNHSPTGKWCKFTQVRTGINPPVNDHYFAVTSPVVAVTSNAYRCTFRIAGNNATTAKVYARFVGFKWYDPPGDGPSQFQAINQFGGVITNVFTETGDPNIDFAGWTDVTSNWADHSPWYLSFNNRYAGARWVALVIKFDGATNDYWGIDNLMIYEGTENLPFQTPSGYWRLGQRPMGFGVFPASVSNPIVVIGTSQGLYQLNNDYQFDPVVDGSWTSAATDNAKLVAFRTFDATDGRLLLACNGESESLQWDGSPQGSAEFINGASTGIIASCLAICFNRVLYGNVAGSMAGGIAYPDGVVITDYLQHDDAVYGGGTSGGSWVARLADTPGPIVAMLEMGNMQTVVYKTDGIYMAIGQGLEPPFRFELRAAGVSGPASALSVVSLSDGVHAYLSNTGDVIIFDGVRPQSMGQHIQAYIQSNADFNKIAQSFGFYLKEKKELYFFYPPYGGGEAFHCIMISMREGEATLWPMRWRDAITAGGECMINLSKTIGDLSGRIGELTGTIGDWTDLRPAILLLDAVGGVLTFEGNTDWRGPIDSYFVTGMYDLGELTSFKTLHEIDHLFIGDQWQTVTVDVLISNYGAEQTSDSPRQVDLTGSGPYVTRHRATGRMFSLYVQANTDGVLRWIGSEASVSVRGLR